MTSIDVTTVATLPSGTEATVTVYEDTDGDNVAENQASTTIADGKNTYTLSGFSSTIDPVRVSAHINGSSIEPGRFIDSISVKKGLTVTAPSDLSTSEVSSGISLAWTDETENEDGYYVYRSASSGSTTSDYTQIADIAEDSTSHLDENVKDGETYYYRVEPYNNNNSELSNEASVTVSLPAPTPSIGSSGGGEMTVSWTKEDDRSDGEWEVFRSTAAGNVGSKIADGLAVSTRNYTDTSTSADTIYYYTVRRIVPE